MRTTGLGVPKTKHLPHWLKQQQKFILRIAAGLGTGYDTAWATT